LRFREQEIAYDFGIRRGARERYGLALSAYGSRDEGRSDYARHQAQTIAFHDAPCCKWL
jgi:hypothetical protein